MSVIYNIEVVDEKGKCQETIMGFDYGLKATLAGNTKKMELVEQGKFEWAVKIFQEDLETNEKTLYLKI